MKIAVTAASGQLGAAIIEQLKKDIGPENVIGMARTPEKAQGLGVEIRKGDYKSKTDFEEGLKGVNAVLLVSANGNPADRIDMHRNVIQGAEKAGVRKVVYTSIVGGEDENSFSAVVKSNRQTEADIQNSSLEWAIGRNGLYIEPDLEYIKTYVKEGGIVNSAGEGKCAYTSREELAFAYSRMLLSELINGGIYNLVGEPITQAELAAKINEVYGTKLEYKEMSPEEYAADRKKELGEFMGIIISGIYEGIRQGYTNPESHFMKASGRPHKSALEMIQSFRDSQ